MHDEYFPDDDEELPEQEHPMWAHEVLQLRSVGIDIGSSTSHLMFSSLTLRRMGISLSSRFVVVARAVDYESPVLLTPYVNPTTIDTEKLSHFIAGAYQQAGMSRDGVDTGAVIVTGEAAKKENAEAIAALFAKEGGKFVCATAGPNLESIMAACGSGALVRSHDGGAAVMNVDVGGGTSKIAVVKDGEILETVAVNIGARLVALDADGRICRIEEAGQLVAGSLGIKLKIGATLPEKDRSAMALVLADCLFEVLERRPLSPLTQSLMITPPLTYSGPIGKVLFSGGVSEYVYDFEKADYGDLGSLLGRNLRAWATQDSGMTLDWPVQRIRATVIGASQYTVQGSGNTIFLSQEGLLPLHNLQVLAPKLGGPRIGAATVTRAIQDAFRRFDLEDGEHPVALAWHWPYGPAYPGLRALTRGIIAGAKKSLRQRQPLVLVFDTDVAKLVGALLADELGRDYPIISIDGIRLQDFDFVDIGEELTQVGAVPVVIKSLLFRVGVGT
ncbi:MAG: ethanolamine ammonia-lyase reactivating factor EutA [Chloroflexi bacterium]|nr:ethanolamine ammonia-lyase reactivating factor EutA [Chloroflexota bacterium]